MHGNKHWGFRISLATLTGTHAVYLRIYNQENEVENCRSGTLMYDKARDTVLIIQFLNQNLKGKKHANYSMQ